MASTSSQIQRTQPQEGQLLNTVLNGATSFVKNHKTISTTYLVGIMLLLFASGIPHLVLPLAKYILLKTKHVHVYTKASRYQMISGTNMTRP
jgi:hypothetical protein